MLGPPVFPTKGAYASLHILSFIVRASCSLQQLAFFEFEKRALKLLMILLGGRKAARRSSHVYKFMPCSNLEIMGSLGFKKAPGTASASLPGAKGVFEADSSSQP